MTKFPFGQIEKEMLFEHKIAANEAVGELLAKQFPNEDDVQEALEIEWAIDDEITKFGLWNEFDEYFKEKRGLYPGRW